jgi:hypothetical protein
MDALGQVGLVIGVRGAMAEGVALGSWSSMSSRTMTGPKRFPTARSTKAFLCSE